MKTHQAVARLKRHKGHVVGLAFSSDDSKLVSVGEDGLRVWRAPSLQQIDAEEKAKLSKK